MKTIEVAVPLAEDYQIDDFLTNTLQYKINQKWIYLTSLELPTNDLKIIEIKKGESEACLTIQIL
jgi:hypothetical protein